MKFIDFFAGIGGFRMGLERTGHQCVGYIEIDKFARKSYEVIYDVKDEWTARDVREVKAEDLPDAEMYVGGFPCQSFSVAGKRGGFKDTRGTLFFEIARLARERKPKVILLENVKGLLNHDGGQTFSTILNTLEELGYWWEYQVLNSKDFGVPQNRERVFIIGHLGGTSRGKVFPIRRKAEGIIKRNQCDVSGKGYDSQQDRVYHTDGLMACLPSSNPGNKTKIFAEGLNTTEEGNSYAITTRTHANYDYKGAVEKSQATLVKACLTPDRINKRQNGRRFKDNGEPMFTLTGQDKHGIAISEGIKPSVRKNFEREKEQIANTDKDIYQCNCESGWQDNKVGINVSPTLRAKNTHTSIYDKKQIKIRKLTPKECWRLQGFPDWAFDKAQKVNSDSQLYKQAGNSVTVNVIEEIGKRL